MNINYHIISISIITLLTLILLSIKATRKILEKKKDLVNFICTIIATFIGVFFAIYFNNEAIRNQEKNTTIKLLEASKNELNLVCLEIETRIESILESKKPVKYELTNHHFPYPIIFPQTIQNEIVLKNITSSSLRALNLQWRGLTIEYDLISEPQNIMAYTDSALIIIIKNYKQKAECSSNLIDNEIELIHNDISKVEFENTIQKLYNDYN